MVKPISKISRPKSVNSKLWRVVFCSAIRFFLSLSADKPLAISSSNCSLETCAFSIRVLNNDSSSPNFSLLDSPTSVMDNTPLSIFAQLLRTNQPIDILTSFLSSPSKLAKSFMANCFLSCNTFRILLSGRPISAYFLPFSVKLNFSFVSLFTMMIPLEANDPAALITDLIFKPVFSAISSGVAFSLISNSFNSFFS